MSLSAGVFSMRTRLLVAASVTVTCLAIFPIASPAATPVPHGERAVCAAAPVGSARCHAHVATNAQTGAPLATTSYTSGYGPAALQSAYQLNAPSGATFVSNGRTVAIVDAYDNPSTAADLVAYRQQFGLPLCLTTSTLPADLVGCLFTKVNQGGTASPLPQGNTGWGQEIDLDIEMVSASCPLCNIVLVEANSNSFSDLTAAVDQAAKLGANAVSNSYGGSEFSSEGSSAYDGHYNHPGIAITVSSGDSGYGVEFPAASQYVTAVGGTSLSTLSSSTRPGSWTETAWSGAGSGCSAYIAKPSWQPTIGTCTTHRIVADVSAVADPNTGVAVYDSYGSSGGANWYVFGGTSVASPIVAGVYALAGNTGPTVSAITYGEYPYSHPSLFDVTSGSNGRCTSRRNNTNLALCTAISGFDGPTGLGTPNGTSAF
jgi:subtilase family serine protease